MKKILSILFLLFAVFILSAQHFVLISKIKVIETGVQNTDMSIRLLDTIPNKGDSTLNNLIGALGPSLEKLKPAKEILVVNGFIIKDKRMIKNFRKMYLEDARKIKILTDPETIKKIGFPNADVILYIKMKRNVFIDYQKLCH